MPDEEPNKVFVAIALDKESLRATVALREKIDPDRMNLLTPEEAIWVGSMILHTARAVSEGNALAERLSAAGMDHDEALALLHAHYDADLALFGQRGAETPREH